MIQTSLSDRVDYLKRVIAASRERQRSNYAMRRIHNCQGDRMTEAHFNEQAQELGRVIREAERDIELLKRAN